MNDLFEDIDELDEPSASSRGPILRIVGIVVVVLLCLVLAGLGWTNRERITAMFGGDDEPTTEAVEETEATAVPNEATESTGSEEIEEQPTATAVATPTTETEPTEAPATNTPLACLSYVRTYTNSNIRAEPVLEDNVLARTEARQVLCVVEEQLWPEEWYRVEYESGEYGWIGSTQVQACFSADNC